ncbi:unnamed protein product, partial [Allacma fusca]
AIRDCGFQ